MSIGQVARLPRYQWLIIGAALSTLVVGLLLGQFLPLLILSISVPFVVFSFQEPLPAIILWQLSSSDFFAFISTDKLGVQLTEGIRINLNDALFVLLLLIAAQRLLTHRTPLMFGLPMTAWIVMLAVSVLTTVIQGNADIGVLPQELRRSIGYAGYFIYIACLDSPKRLKAMLGFWFVTLLVAVSIQVVEFATTQRFPAIPGFELPPSNYLSQLVEVSVNGISVPYVWPRADISIGLYLALGALSETPSRREYLVVVILGVIGTLLGMIRQEYVGLVIGFLVVILLRPGKVKALVTAGLVAVLIMLLASVGSNLLSDWLPLPLQDLWSRRADTLLTFQQDGNFAYRIQLMVSQINLLRESPLLGLGMSRSFQQAWSTDLGITNTLLKFGVVGTAIIMYLVLFLIIRAYNLYQRMPSSTMRGIVIGTVALLVSRLAMSVVGTDTFTSGALIAVAMGVVDRIATFSKNDQLT